jgi:uncharacterized protein YutE (UPF0331/DUF86 family)
MIFKEILWSKIEAAHRHLERIRVKREVAFEDFLHDLDRQESVLLNLQMVIQNCIDLAAHVVSEEGLGIAGSTDELFHLLEDRGIVSRELTERMVLAVGFRNVVVHEYTRVDLELVFRVCHDDLKDLEAFLRVLGERYG